MGEKLVQLLREQNKTISTMESCTGGGFANEITNHEGASEVLRFSAVTYSNEFKIKMGVPAEVIDKYTVYSMETAKEMSRHIAQFTKSNYGIGITGKLNRADKANKGGSDHTVFVSIYNQDVDTFTCFSLEAAPVSRMENKVYIIHAILEKLVALIGEEDDKEN